MCCLSPYLACSGNLCSTFDRPFRAKNNSHAHRAGKCAKHFLLLETSTGQNPSRFFPSFPPRPFYPPSRSSLALFPSFLIPRPVPLSLSFLPPHIPRSFNSPAHDQMLKSFAASECVHTRHGNLSWSLEGGQQQHRTDPDCRAAFPQWKCDTSPLCFMPFNKKKPKKKNPVPVHFSRCGCFFFSAAFFYHSSCQFCSKQKAQQRCTQSRIFNLDPQSSVSSKFQPSIFIVGQLPDIATAERDKKKCEMTKPDTTLIKEKVW